MAFEGVALFSRGKRGGATRRAIAWLAAAILAWLSVETQAHRAPWEAAVMAALLAGLSGIAADQIGKALDER